MKQPKKFLTDTCGLGKLSKCCRFLVVGPDGFECVKLTDKKDYIDGRVTNGTFNALGDNCDGLPTEESLKKLN